MHMSFTVFKYSAGATLCSIAGSVLFVFGAFGTIGAIMDGTFSVFALLIAVAGIVLLFLARKINDAVVKRKLQKAMEDEKLIEEIRTSAVSAYSFYKNIPCEEILGFIGMHHPAAAQNIRAYADGTITEDELILCLRAYDQCPDGETVSPEKVLYENEMFTLEAVKIGDEIYRDETERFQYRMRKNKISLMVFGAVTLTAAVLFLATLGLQEEREITPFSHCEIGDYTVVEAVSLTPYRTQGGYGYYFFETADGESGNVRLSAEDQAASVKALVNGAGSSVRLHGTLQEEEGSIRLGGTAVTHITMPVEILYAATEPDTELAPITLLAMLIVCVGGVGLFVTFVNRVEFKTNYLHRMKQIGYATIG